MCEIRVDKLEPEHQKKLKCGVSIPFENQPVVLIVSMKDCIWP